MSSAVRPATEDTVAAAARAPLTVAVLADDLIWSTRLAAALTEAGARPVTARTADGFGALMPAADRAIVDLTARAYDGVTQVGAAVASGVRVIAVGQHDDVELRRRALAAGAERVHAYRRLSESGPRILAAWLAEEPA